MVYADRPKLRLAPLATLGPPPPLPLSAIVTTAAKPAHMQHPHVNQ